MRALSLFSGIGGIDLGLERAGIRVVGQCEADEWCRAVLAERFPGVPCWDDVARLGLRGREPERMGSHGGRVVDAPGGDTTDRVDLVCGGFPCQDVSVAGKRAGLAGARTGLFWEFLRIADALRPRWLLLENVPGLLSSNHGRDFATIISALDDAGYVGAWRVLDSRWFGVPQRRRRVFILCADARVDPRGERASEVLAVGTRCARHPRTGGEEQRPDPGRASDGARAADRRRVMAVSENQRAEVRETDFAYSITSGGGKPGQGYPMARIGAGVRRLTPRECERLQGFPDDWTQIDWKGKPSPDSRRYAALGNAVTVQVAEWIAHRIAAADAVLDGV